MAAPPLFFPRTVDGIRAQLRREHHEALLINIQVEREIRSRQAPRGRRRVGGVALPMLRPRGVRSRPQPSGRFSRI